MATWLRELGLEQYERAFLDQDIDTDVLPQLTADDLIAVGVASVGHRRKLLSAIAALNQSEPSAPPSACSGSPGSPSCRMISPPAGIFSGSTLLRSTIAPGTMSSSAFSAASTCSALLAGIAHSGRSCCSISAGSCDA
jgi:SAM (Sterile alpha motif) domain-containing protein